MTEIIGGALLIEGMKRVGVKHVFGMPGFQLMSAYDAIYQSGGEIRHILVHDEKCGAFMADAYARASGRPGVCDATVGPGATNLVSCLAESYYASTPLVAVTSDVRMEFASKSPNQECDQVTIFRPIVKVSWTIHMPESIHEATRRAFHLSVSGRPRPVHLNLPENINYSTISYDWEKQLADFKPVSFPFNRPGPDADALHRAVSLLKKARRPVCIAGGGVHISETADLLLQLAEKVHLPDFQTLRFDRLAQDFGWRGVRIESEGRLVVANMDPGWCLAVVMSAIYQLFPTSRKSYDMIYSIRTV